MILWLLTLVVRLPGVPGSPKRTRWRLLDVPRSLKRTRRRLPGIPGSKKNVFFSKMFNGKDFDMFVVIVGKFNAWKLVN